MPQGLATPEPGEGMARRAAGPPSKAARRTLPVAVFKAGVAQEGAASPLGLLTEGDTAAPPDPDEGRDGPSVGARGGPGDGRGPAHTARRFARARGLDPDAPGAGRPS